MGAQSTHLPKPELKVHDGKIHFSLQIPTDSDNLVAEMMILAGKKIFVFFCEIKLFF